MIHNSNHSILPSSDQSVAIIGAGPGGLAAAMQLAAAGMSVRVYEAQPIVGGRTRRITKGDYSFDCGPTFFLMPYVLEEIFSACGFRLSDFVELQRLDPMYRLIIGDKNGPPKVIETTQNVDEMVRRISAIEPEDGPAFRRFMNDNRVKLERLTPVLKSRVRSIFDMITLEGLQAAPHVRPWESVYTQLGKYFKNPKVRLSVCFQAKYLGMSPYECPSIFSILPFIEYEYGIWHPKGGCNSITTAMAHACEKMGVEIVTNAPVEQIAFDGKRVTGVVVGGHHHQHDRVVVNADGTWALKNLVPAKLRPRDTDEGVDSRRYSCSTFMLYLGLKGAVDLPHHTIFMSGNYEDNFRDISHDGKLSEDPSAYVHNPSPLDPSLAPAGNSSLYVLLPVTNNRPAQCQLDWAVEKPRLREDAMRQLETVFGIKDIRSRIEVEHLVSPLDWQNERINHGATFNLAHNYSQMLHRRIPHTYPGLDVLHFVGGATHPGSGLPVIFLSSTITTRHICELQGIDHPLAAPTMATA